MKRTKTLTLVGLGAFLGLFFVWELGKPPTGFLSTGVVARLVSQFHNFNALSVYVDKAFDSSDLEILLEIENGSQIVVFSE